MLGAKGRPGAYPAVAPVAHTLLLPPVTGGLQVVGSMFIYIDESGSFVPSPTAGSWNVVAAYVVPEPTRRHLEEILRRFKVGLGRSTSEELKLRDISEAQARSFVSEIGELDATLFVSAIDAGSQSTELTSAHQRGQVCKILENRPEMLYEGGRALIDDLSARVGRLSPQLYTQFVTQMDLLDQVYRSATLYYAQRIPGTLGAFRWRIDEKNSLRPQFEETIRYMAPPILQSKSMKEPAVFVEGFDYSHYERAFRFEPEDIPEYIQMKSGTQIRSASNLGKVLRDFQFVCSHDVSGVQVCDLLASAFRRTLRNQFADSLGMARLLGKLTVQRQKPQAPIHLITLGEEQIPIGHVLDVALATKKVCRQMLK
jgi:hypothetical protein